MDTNLYLSLMEELRYSPKETTPEWENVKLNKSNKVNVKPHDFKRRHRKKKKAAKVSKRINRRKK